MKSDGAIVLTSVTNAPFDRVAGELRGEGVFDTLC